MPSSRKRLINLYRILLIAFIALSLRIFWIQIIKGSDYKEQAESQRYYEISTSYNGTIYDRNMIPLTNRETQKYLYAPRYNLISDQDYYNELIEKTNIPKEELNKYINTEYNRIIKIPIDEDVENIDMKNTFILEEYKEYSDENILVHTIGHINDNGKGFGVREIFDDTLSLGKESKLLLTFDGKNRLLYDENNYMQVNKNRDTVRDSIQLTVDYEIQKIVEDAMESRNYYGAAIVTDIKTGEILASTSQPEFDPKDLEKTNNSNKGEQLNRVIKYPYYPASVFKTIVLLSALENDIDLKQTLTCKGYIYVGDRKKPYKCHNDIVHGELTIKEAYAQSCNTIFIQLAQKIGEKKIIETVKNIGLDNIVDIGLKGEKKGMISSLDKLRGGGIANLAMGQEHIMLTPIQINNMTMIIANNGIKKDLSIVKGYATNNGQESRKFNKEEDKWLINSDYTNVIKEYMKEVVESGTGSKYISPDDYGGAAGKTGTAQKGSGSNNGLFTGYSPTDNPKYAITVIVEGIGSKSGASTAGVVFDDILKKINELSK